MHEAVGSMPAQPIKDRNTEEIITPIEEVKEEIVTNEAPSEEGGLASAVGDFTNKAVTNEDEELAGEVNEPSDDVPTESETSDEEGEEDEE
jgi:hypothetical protein